MCMAGAKLTLIALSVAPCRHQKATELSFALEVLHSVV